MLGNGISANQPQALKGILSQYALSNTERAWTAGDKGEFSWLQMTLTMHWSNIILR